jgi:hypothetical protein
MKVKELSNLQVQRVDLVDRAAVRDPDHPDQPTRFLVWKAESARNGKGKENPDEETSEETQENPEEEAQETAEEEAQEEAEEPEAQGKKKSTKAELSTADVNDLPDSAFAVVKPGGNKDDRMLPHHKPDGGVDLPHLRNALARANQPGTKLSPAQRKAALAHLAAHASKEDVGEHDNQSSKAEQGGVLILTDEATGTVETVAKADYEAVVKRAEDAEKIAKEEREIRLRSEHINKAEREFGHLPGTAVEKGEMLLELRKSCSPELFSKVEAVFKSAEEMATNSKLFTQLGAVSQNNGTGSAYAEIEAKAAELRKGEPKLTQAQAIAKAAADNPDLYARYRSENPIPNSSN